MGLGAHVLEVVADADEFDEAAVREGEDGVRALAIELGFELGQTCVLSGIHDASEQGAKHAEATELGMNEGTDHADVALPATGALVQGGVAGHTIPGKGDKWQLALEIEAVTPVMELGADSESVLVQEALLFRDFGIEGFEGALIGFLERAHGEVQAVCERVMRGEFFECVFKHSIRNSRGHQASSVPVEVYGSGSANTCRIHLAKLVLSA